MERDGFLVLRGVLPPVQIDAFLADLDRALQAQAADVAFRSDTGSVYAARNLLTVWPAAATTWRQPPLPAVLATVLGPDFGLVRALYFDKPPDGTWALPWHKDLTVAVRDNRLPSLAFTKPTRKAGVPHAEAPQEILDRMVTARIHLDGVTEENGPLQVLPGSHRSGKALRLEGATPRRMLVERGDVLLIRPLVAHSSGRSHPGTRRHRRVVHLEFAASEFLPDGYEWYDFRPARDSNW
jgi:hypothetical protein